MRGLRSGPAPRRGRGQARAPPLKCSDGRVDPGCVPAQRPIERAFLRQARDGSTVFFPWGLERRGIRLPDDAAVAEALRAVSLLFASVIGIGVWTASRLEKLLESESNGLREALATLAAPGAALLVVVVAYLVWASRFAERFPRSDLAISREERLREAAALAEPGKIAAVGAVTIAMSALVVWLQPRAWWLGALGALMGAALLAWTASLRRAASLRGAASQRGGESDPRAQPPPG